MNYAPPPPYSWWCGVTPQKLRNWINATNLTQACFTLILDTCFSGYWTDFMRNVTVLSACGKDETAWGGGWKDGPCGIFTVGLFNSFQIENDTNADGWLSLAEIFPYARNYTTEHVTWSRQNPECYYGLVEGDIPLLQKDVNKPFPTWDVSVISILVNPIVRPNSLVPINLTVANHGVKNTTFDITMYLNNSKMQSLESALEIGENATFTFTWNTTGFYGTYLLRFTVSICPGEKNITDNAAEVWICVAIQGDINCDGSVNNYDVALFGSCFGSAKGDSAWNFKADLNNDEYINFLDAILLSVNFGESYHSTFTCNMHQWEMLKKEIL